MEYKYDKKAVDKIINNLMQTSEKSYSFERAHFVDKPQDGPLFITREGKMIWGSSTHNAILSILFVNLYNKYVDFGPKKDEWDFFERELG